MTAETKEAKKALEGSLNDLRSSLGQHKLTVDQVKVDVGNQLASDNREGNKDSQQQQQKQMDMNRDQRNQTREFWSEFQNQGQSRGTFQESPGIRAYSGARRPDPLTPNNSPSVGEKRYVGSGKGRGLDLVG
jgi:flagellar hook-length control protein FliK